MGAKTIEFTDANFETEVKKSNIPVLVDFWAPWCGPCLRMTPIIDEIAEELDGKVKVGKLNVDDNSQVAMEFRITSIPTIMIFKGGAKVNEIVGARPKEQIIDILSKL